MLAPIVDKDLKQKLFLEVVLRVLEGLINRGFFLFSIFTPSSVQCSVHLTNMRTARATRRTAAMQPTTMPAIAPVESPPGGRSGRARN